MKSAPFHHFFLGIIATFVLVSAVFSSCKKEEDAPLPPPPNVPNEPTDPGNTELEIGTVTDAFGVTYPTVKIGNQWWTTENLKATKFQNGDDLLNVISDWSANNEPAWCYYDNNPIHANRGMLYNHKAVTDPRNLCPEGWRVPSDTDFQELIDHLGGENQAGHALKSGLFWLPSSDANANTSGFNSYPGGYRHGGGVFYDLSGYAGYWSTTSFDDTNAWHRYLVSVGADVYRSYAHKKSAYSCRCVK